jgi:hypothetical protein
LDGQGPRGYFQKLTYGSETLDMTSEGLGEIIEGDSEDGYQNTFHGNKNQLYFFI